MLAKRDPKRSSNTTTGTELSTFIQRSYVTALQHCSCRQHWCTHDINAICLNSVFSGLLAKLNSSHIVTHRSEFQTANFVWRNHLSNDLKLWRLRHNCILIPSWNLKDSNTSDSNLVTTEQISPSPVQKCHQNWKRWSYALERAFQEKHGKMTNDKVICFHLWFTLRHPAMGLSFFT